MEGTERPSLVTGIGLRLSEEHAESSTSPALGCPGGSQPLALRAVTGARRSHVGNVAWGTPFQTGDLQPLEAMLLAFQGGLCRGHSNTRQFPDSFLWSLKSEVFVLSFFGGGGSFFFS